MIKTHIPYHPVGITGPPMLVPPPDSYRREEFLYGIGGRIRAGHDRSPPRFLKGIDHDDRTITPTVKWCPPVEMEKRRRDITMRAHYYTQKLKRPEDDTHELRRLKVPGTRRDLMMTKDGVRPRRILKDELYKTYTTPEAKTGISRHRRGVNVHSQAHPDHTWDAKSHFKYGSKIAHKKRTEALMDISHLFTKKMRPKGTVRPFMEELCTRKRRYDESEFEGFKTTYISSKDALTHYTSEKPTLKRVGIGKIVRTPGKLHHTKLSEPRRSGYPTDTLIRVGPGKHIRKSRMVPTYTHDYMKSHPTSSPRMDYRPDTSVPLVEHVLPKPRHRGIPESYVEAYTKRMMKPHSIIDSHKY